MLPAVSLIGYFSQINLLDLLSPLGDREDARGRDRSGKWDGQCPEPDGQA